MRQTNCFVFASQFKVIQSSVKLSYKVVPIDPEQCNAQIVLFVKLNILVCENPGDFQSFK